MDKIYCLYLKVSQGEAHMNFFQVDWQKLDKCISIIISMSMLRFFNFEARFLTLFKDKVSKNAPKHEIV